MNYTYQVLNGYLKVCGYLYSNNSHPAVLYIMLSKLFWGHQLLQYKIHILHKAMVYFIDMYWKLYCGLHITVYCTCSYIGTDGCIIL